MIYAKVKYNFTEQINVWSHSLDFATYAITSYKELFHKGIRISILNTLICNEGDVVYLKILTIKKE